MNDSHASRVIEYNGVNSMGTSLRPIVWLHRYAIIVAVATWLLIVAGGMVTSTGSGLSVPDWPTTYGENMFTYPYSKWVGGIFYEHSHRLIASTVGMLTIILCIWLWMKERRRWLRNLGFVALFAVIAQGILGGLTVKFLLPTPVSVAHACLAQAFFCTVVAIAVFTSPRWIGSQPARREPSPRFETPKLGMLVVAVVFLQLLLGAIMRHTESGLAVLDFPLAYGQVVPDLSPDAVERYNDHRRFDMLLPAITVRQIEFHLAHRAGALLVAGMVFVVCVSTLNRYRNATELCRPILFAAVLVGVQFGLGAWTVLSERHPYVATAHVAVGAATLAASVVFTLRAYRMLGASRHVVVPAGVMVGATA